MSKSQLAMIGERMLPQLEAEAKKRQQATQLAGKDAEGKPARSSVPPEVEGPKDSGEAEGVSAVVARLLIMALAIAACDFARAGAFFGGIFGAIAGATVGRRLI